LSLNTDGEAALPSPLAPTHPTTSSESLHTALLNPGREDTAGSVDLGLRLPDLLSRLAAINLSRAQQLPTIEDAPSALPPLPSLSPRPNKAPNHPSPATVIEEIGRELPVGIELHRSYHYQVPFAKKGRLDLIIVKLYCPEELEHKLEDWRRRVDERYESVTILVRRVSVDQGIQSHLKNRFKSRSVLTDSVRGTLKIMMEELCGRQPGSGTAARQRPPRREDLTDVPFVAIDRHGTRDAEDLVHAEWKKGSLYFRAAYINATDFVRPGSNIDKFALRVGATIYGRAISIATLGSELAHGAVSFIEGLPRPAWVVEGRLTPFQKRSESGKSRTDYALRYRVRSAYVINHRNIDPTQPLDTTGSDSIARCLAGLTDAARILERRRTSKPSLLRIEGEDAASKVLAEIMIESKRILARYLGEHRKAPTIYRVHTKPSAQVVASFVEKLGALGIPAHVDDLEKPSEFAGILRSLEARNSEDAQSLLNSLIDTYLLRSQYSTQNEGHFGLRLDEYLEIKPRDASGLANQYQLAALFEKRELLSEKEMHRRASTLNEKRWRRDELNYKLRFLEMLHDKLEHVKNRVFFAKMAGDGDRPYVEVEGFSKWGLLHGRISSVPLPQDAPVVVTLKGFHLRYMRFIFELAY
jgi:hypothetical protein